MEQSLWERLKARWCRWFGHGLVRTNGNISCHRCNRLISTKYMRENCSHPTSHQIADGLYQCDRCLDIYER